jgi:hypothetical protein
LTSQALALRRPGSIRIAWAFVPFTVTCVCCAFTVPTTMSFGMPLTVMELSVVVNWSGGELMLSCGGVVSSLSLRRRRRRASARGAWQKGVVVRHGEVYPTAELSGLAHLSTFLSRPNLQRLTLRVNAPYCPTALWMAAVPIHERSCSQDRLGGNGLRIFREFVPVRTRENRATTPATRWHGGRLFGPLVQLVAPPSAR